MANIGGGQTADFYWLLIDATNPAWPTIQAAALAKHRGTHARNTLGARMSRAGTRALVKVTRGSAAWVGKRAWRATVLRVYTEADHDAAKALLRTPAWTPVA